RQFFELRNQLTVRIEQFLWFLRAHPFFENLKLLGVFLHVRHGNLVGPPKPLQPVSTDLRRRSPAFRGSEEDHWPARTLGDSRGSTFLLVVPDFGNAVFHSRRHRLVHAFGVGSLHKIRRPAVTLEQVLHFLVADSSQ